MNSLVRWLIALLIPFFFALVVMTVVISPWYPTWEYAKPNFPPDPLGWTQETRLELATVAVEYLAKPAPAEDYIFMLEEQLIPETSEPLYNDREIKHMLDVKILSDLFRRVAWVLGGIIGAGLLLFGFFYENGRAMIAGTLFRGGMLTILILLSFGLFIGLAWDVFFVQFHEVLFDDGTWTFNYTDSLIRLFPEKFWFDVGVLIVGSTFGLGVLSALIGRFLRPTPRVK